MIKDITLSEIYNSCGDKAIKVSIKNENGTFFASSPSGTSTGTYEAKTLDLENTRKIFSKIKWRFIGEDEKEVDKTIEKIGLERIGSSLSLALSIASIRALTKNDAYRFFKKEAESFPYPLGNTIGGGAHSGYISEQEFLVIPLRARTIKEAIKTNLSVWKEVGKTLKPFITGRNRENAWICKLNDLKSLEILYDIAEDHGARLGIDFAANNIFKDGRYYYRHPDRNFSPDNQLDFVLSLIKNYKLVYVEDPFHENDFQNFAELTRKAKCLVTGDDIFATQSSRLKLGTKKKAGNAIIIKPNQAGTISRTLETISLAKKARYTTVVSHRSCETKDSFIADLAFGIGTPLIKCAARGKEREAKFKRLEEIWKRAKKPKMAKLILK